MTRSGTRDDAIVHAGAHTRTRPSGTPPVAVEQAKVRMPETMDGPTAAQAWRSRLDAGVTTAARSFLLRAADELPAAPADGATLRVLSADGQWLLPLAAYHVVPRVSEEIEALMFHTADSARSGVWRPVVERRETISFDVANGGVPPGASPRQARFVRSHPVTHILATPVVLDGRVVGGLGVVRFVVREPFDDDQKHALHRLAQRSVEAVDFRALGAIELTADS